MDKDGTFREKRNVPRLEASCQLALPSSVLADYSWIVVTSRSGPSGS